LGVLPRDTYQTIVALKAGSADNGLSSRVCALIWLIEQLPRDLGGDTHVRATPDTLADLLVEDLSAGSTSLRGTIPGVLDKLVESGRLMPVEDEYHIQTAESADWWSAFNNIRAQLLRDEHRIAEERQALLVSGCEARLKGLQHVHGKSKVPRKAELHFGQEPSKGTVGIPVWIRDGWVEQERTVLADARSAGPEDPASLAQEAGGDAPRPLRPSVVHIEDLRSLGGNELMAAVYDQRERFAKEAKQWRVTAGMIEARLPRWQDLEWMLPLARGLLVEADVMPQVTAIRDERRLLDEPDPVPPLCKQLADALRAELHGKLEAYQREYDKQASGLESCEAWRQLDGDQRRQVLTDAAIAAPRSPDVSDERALTDALMGTSHASSARMTRCCV